MNAKDRFSSFCEELGQVAELWGIHADSLIRFGGTLDPDLFDEADAIVNCIKARAMAKLQEEEGEEKDGSLSGAAVGKGQDVRSEKRWPDPSKHTTAKVWTTKDGAFHISTKTDGERDGKVSFGLGSDGGPTKQMQLMRLVAHKHPEKTQVFEIIDEVYFDDRAGLSNDPVGQKKLLNRVTSLVTGVRQKLEKAGLNQDILSPLDRYPERSATTGLCVAKLHKLDDHDLDEADAGPALE